MSTTEETTAASIVNGVGLDLPEKGAPPPEPTGPGTHRVDSPHASWEWVREELGQRGLSGVLLRGGVPVHCASVGEAGYIEPPKRRNRRDGAVVTSAAEPDDNGPATVKPVTAEELAARVSLNYTVWRRLKTKPKDGQPGWTKTFIPAESCAKALVVPDALPHLRPLHGVTHTPMVRADGSILAAPGYDEDSGFLHLPSVEVPSVPTHPSPAELAEATRYLRALVAQFPWAGEHDEANYWGATLTPLLRELVPPPYKLIALGAHQPGSGKSLLAELLRIIHGGVFRSEMPHDDAELEKSLTAILASTTAPVVTFDNVSGTLRSSRLDGVLTSREFSGRTLGGLQHPTLVNDRLWTITGNNLSLGGDLLRRTLWVTIDPGMPDPHLRTGFTIPDLPGYVRRNRDLILYSLLVWVAAWRAAGCHLAPLESSDQYATWTSVVRAILGHASVPGVFGHLESAQQRTAADDEGWDVFLGALREVFGHEPFTTRDVIDRLSGGSGYGAEAERRRAEAELLTGALPDDLAEKYHRNNGRAVTQSLGMWIRNRVGRFVGEPRLAISAVRQDRSRNLPLWRVIDDPRLAGQVPR